MRLRDKIFSSWAYVRHQSCANNTLGYGIHSPYLFNIARTILTSTEPYYAFEPIKALRRNLLSEEKTVYVEDFGTGRSGKRRVSDIARTSLKPRRESQLLMRLGVMQGARELLELGTSLGITSAYLASIDSRAHLTTFEGAPELAKTARAGWQQLGIQNITCIEGDINLTLPKWQPEKPLDFVFIDANHTGESLLRYFELTQAHRNEHAIFAIDDIHASRDMEQAWERICKHKEVSATMDLYSMGLVFFDPNLEKKTYRIRF